MAMTASPASLTSPFSSLVVSASFAQRSPLCSTSSVTWPSQVRRRTELGDGDEAGCKGAQPRGRDRVGQGLAEAGHHEHAVREDIGISGGLGEIQIDVNRIVIPRRAAIERELVTADRRELLVQDAVADRELTVQSLAHAATLFSTTTVREQSATWTPCWLVTLVSTTASVMAPPFLSVMLAMRGSKRSVSPTMTGAR